MKWFITCLLFSCCFIACQSVDTDTETTTESITTEAPVAEKEATKAEKITPEATSKTEVNYLETSIGQIPVYSSFEGVESIFNQNNDTTYVINFWATWCKPCVEELPYFELVQKKYKDEKIQVVLVSLDFKRQLEKKLKPFLEERNLVSRVVVLTDNKYNNWINRVDADWGGAIPVTVVYNAKERQFVGEQFANFEELDAIVQRVAAM